MKQLRRMLFVIAIIVASCSACTQQKKSPKINNDHTMEQTEENAKKQKDKEKEIDEAIKQYIARDKFAATSDYPGLGDEELRQPLNELLNTLAETFKKIAHNKSDERMYQIAIKQLLDQLDNVYLDSEDQDQFCVSIEALMDIVSLESSGGLLNKWRYGFIPEDNK